MRACVDTTGAPLVQNARTPFLNEINVTPLWLMGALSPKLPDTTICGVFGAIGWCDGWDCTGGTRLLVFSFGFKVGGCVSLLFFSLPPSLSTLFQTRDLLHCHPEKTHDVFRLASAPPLAQLTTLDPRPYHPSITRLSQPTT